MAVSVVPVTVSTLAVVVYLMVRASLWLRKMLYKDGKIGEKAHYADETIEEPGNVS